jgi:hypothetical protein
MKFYGCKFRLCPFWCIFSDFGRFCRQKNTQGDTKLFDNNLSLTVHGRSTDGLETVDPAAGFYYMLNKIL